MAFHPSRSLHPHAALGLMILAGSAITLVAGCSSAPRQAPVTSPGVIPEEEQSTPNNGLSAMAARFAKHPETEESTVFTPEAPREARPDAASPSPGVMGRPTPAATITVDTNPQPAPPVDPPEPVKVHLTPEAEIAAKAAELRALLAAQAPSRTDVLNARLGLSALDSFFSGPGERPAVNLRLSPAEQRIAAAVGDLFTKLDAQTRTTADAPRLAELFAAAADSLASNDRVRISYAGLCRRVDSFGRFEPFTSTAFLAGQAQKAIVYVELDRFAARTPNSADIAAGQNAGWVVEISQELELIHDADGRQQWYRPPQTITDSSRTRRRDFYLVNTIELPATLSVGAYSLKVTIRDKTSGSTDEQVIPLQIIADASATQSPRSVSLMKKQPPQPPQPVITPFSGSDARK